MSSTTSSVTSSTTVDEIKFLIKECGDINKASRSTTTTFLHEAVNADNLEVVKFLVEQGAKLDVVNYQKETPLTLVKSLKMFQYLVSQGADPNTKGLFEESLLFHVTNPEVVKVLVEIYGLDPKFINRYITITVLHRREIPLETIKYYVETCGVDPKILDSQKRNATHFVKDLKVLKYLVEERNVDPSGVFEITSNLEILKYLVQRGVSFKKEFSRFHFENVETLKFLVEELKFPLDKQKKYVKPAVSDYMYSRGLPFPKGIISDSVLSGESIERIQYLINTGASLEEEDCEGYIPFLNCQTPEMVDFFVNELGFDPRTRTKCGITLMCITNSAAVVKHLVLNYGIGINEELTRDRVPGVILRPATPLIHAMYNGNIDLIKFLIEQGAEFPDSDDNDRFTTPIHFCDDLEILEMMLPFVKNINAKDHDGCTALHRAAKSWKNEKVKFLIENGADINAQDDNGRTALHHMCRQGLINIVEILVDSGADLEIKDKDGNVPVFYARSPDVAVKVLKKMGRMF